MAYTDEQRAEALDLYMDRGAAHAGRVLGIPSGTVRVWAHRAGLKRYGPEQTAEATAAHQRQAAELRSELRAMLLDQALDLIDRMNAPHKDFRGKDADEVWWDTAPADACRAYATAAAILIDKYRLEMGETTGRHQMDVRQVESQVDTELRQAIDEFRRQIIADH